jgi:hypothetical protein
MKYIISLSLLLLGTNAVRDNDEAFRLLRGQGMMGQGGGQGQMMGGGGQGMTGQGGGQGMMGGGGGQGMMGQGGGQGMMGGGGQGMMGGGGRNHTAEDKAEMCAEKGIVCAEVDLDFLANNCTRPEHPNSDRDLLMIVEEVHDEFLDGDHRSLRRPGPGGHGGQGGGRFGNMTDADREEMMLKRLTCKCCMEDDGDQN